MAFNIDRRKRSMFPRKQSKVIEGPNVDDFKGTVYAEGNNILSLVYGQLQSNINMEFRNSANKSFIQTRRGTTLISDIATKALGAGLFFNGTEKLPVWIDTGGNLRYLDGSTVVDFVSGKDTSSIYEYFMYQLKGVETLYYANFSEGLRKLTYSSGFTDTQISSLAGQNINSMAFSNISGRMIVAIGHGAYYSLVQDKTTTDTTNLESFNTTTQFFWVNPDNGQGILKVVDDGQITFLFKDTGIWALINAYEDPVNWIVPKTDSDVGTKSPETVQYCRYGQSEGYIFLASDKTLRFFNGSVQRNSGTRPTLIGGSSKIISKDFQVLLNDIPSGQLKNCVASFFGRYYILSIFSASGTAVDRVIVVDTEKLLPLKNDDDINQPYWFLSNDLLFDAFIRYDYDNLYGFSVDGYISRLFVDGVYTDEIPSRVTPDGSIQDYITTSGGSGTMYVGETITGSISGTTGTVQTPDIDALYALSASAEWTIGETITGSISGATAVIVSVNRYKGIEWEGYLSWQKYASRELQFYDGYLHWETESRSDITFTLNSFIFGESIPAYDDTIEVSLKPSLAGGSYFDVDYFDIAYFDSPGNNQVSQNIGKETRGNYFSFGFKSNGINSWAKIYGLETRFRVTRSGVMGRNI